jgi:hypothetical protein
MRTLQLGVSTCHLGARLTQPKTELPEHALALTHAKLVSILLLNPGAQRLPVPDVRFHSHISWTLAQHPAYLDKLAIIQTPRSARAFPFLQAGQAAALEPLHPVLDAACRIPEQATHLGAGHTLRDQQNTVQAVVVARFLRPPYLVLKAQDNSWGIDNAKRSHISMRPQSRVMRNYL